MTEYTNLLPDINSMNQLFTGNIRDPHAVLGMHDIKGYGIVIRVFDPEALSIQVLSDGKKHEMKKVGKEGLFQLGYPGRETHFAYQLCRKYKGTECIAEDPYQFMPQIGELDCHLFNEGEHHEIYNVLGAHVHKCGNVPGVEFGVWAPNAQRVSVVGDFNGWDGRRNPMRLLGSSGIWELFIPRMKPGEIYKYEIRTSTGDIVLKLDPYAQRTERRPHNAGIVPAADDFVWTDAEYLSERAKRNPLTEPVNIYEVHLGTWGGPGLSPFPQEHDRIKDKDYFHNYRDIAHALAEYVIKMGYTHVELLPVSEHPLDQSWGYQVTGFFAPTARYGTPEDFAYFIDYMHSKGIGVILDWVPAHFPKDAFSLGRFDGTALYEHADPRQGEQRDWGTYIFNFGRREVLNFLIGSALFWLKKYHVDGLRVDAVASMLFLNYSREDGQWIPNKYGGNENLEAIAFLKRLNELTHQLNPGIMMIAEESSTWPGVSRPVYLGGLGFTFKWNMGWMHDTLDYFSLDPIYRSYHHNKLTFSQMYAFTENFVIPLSHDEVVHGKLSLIGRMPGDYVQKFANLRALFAYMMTHPGKKLMFMGGEFGQMIEWNCNQDLDWFLLKYPSHDAFHRMVAELNAFYKKTPALWEVDCTPEGFQWIEPGDYQQSVYSYIRWDKKGQDPCVVVLNLTPVVRDDYVIGVPYPGEWVEVFNTDRPEYGGTGILNGGTLRTDDGLFHGHAQHIHLRLPWLGAVILQRKMDEK